MKFFSIFLLHGGVFINGKENMCMHGDAKNEMGFHSHDYSENIKCGGVFNDLSGTVASPVIPVRSFFMTKADFEKGAINHSF